MTSPIGTPVNRVEGRAKVTGAAKYAADHKLDRLAYGYLLTSTVGKGTITAMDTAAAAAAPGVVAVYSPFNSLKLFTYTQNQNDEQIAPLQDNLVRYYGQVIAFVVAETFEQARDATGLIKVTYAAEPPTASFLDNIDKATPTSSPVV
jgi:xanthine dehydrogenase YagR molybdenum-binding subunit